MSSFIRRTATVGLAGSVVAVLAVLAPIAAPAYGATLTRETFTFADPFGGSFECDGFSAHYEGHDHGFVSTWFDSSGEPVLQEGHIWAVETDYNDSTGASVVVQTSVQVHVDYSTDTQRLTGIRNLSTVPGSGVVIQSVGLLAISPSTDVLIALHGPADDVNLGGGFCEALAG